jgi:hypothetical protein
MLTIDRRADRRTLIGLKPKRLVVRTILPLVFVVLVGSQALAQGGGKAEPLRIEFKHRSTATISDKISGTQEAEYVFMARKGQRLTIKLTSVPTRSAVFDLKAPENADLGLEYDANYNYNGTLPKTGDYLIIVVRPTTSPGTASYKFTVTVR